jgi:hypothetical protein
VLQQPVEDRPYLAATSEKSAVAATRPWIQTPNSSTMSTLGAVFTLIRRMAAPFAPEPERPCLEHQGVILDPDVKAIAVSDQQQVSRRLW